ncbi:MAG TPA: DUF2007 domain-containing protein [Oceanipulchritudo sp.]|nr:DUF2007 domain-containing protein [Oceanipulchritudo sp.]
MKLIGSYTKAEEAHLVASLLDANGIRAVVLDENTATLNWFYANAIGGVKVEVFDEDLEAAREVLSLPKEHGILPACPDCGSEKTRVRELSLLTAAVLGFLGFIIPHHSVKVDCLECGKTFKHAYKKHPGGDSPGERRK